MADDDGECLIKSGLQSAIDCKTRKYLAKEDLPGFFNKGDVFFAWQWGEVFVRVEQSRLILNLMQLKEWLKNGFVELVK